MIKESIYLEFLDALTRGEKTICHQIVTDTLNEGVCIKEIYLQIFQKALYQIGRMWEQGKMNIADEHMATQIIECLLSRHSFTLSGKNCGHSVVITCIDKEFHLLGAKMVANMFELNGWNVFFMGSSSPGKEVLRTIADKKPDVVGISFSFYLNYLRFLELLESVILAFPNQEVVVGGQGLTASLQLKLKTDYPKVKYISCINALDEYILRFSSCHNGI